MKSLPTPVAVFALLFVVERFFPLRRKEIKSPGSVVVQVEESRWFFLASFTLALPMIRQAKMIWFVSGAFKELFHYSWREAMPQSKNMIVYEAFIDRRAEICSEAGSAGISAVCSALFDPTLAAARYSGPQG